ncbi:LamG-like jellyroll fold domain-containing protein [Streptomyces sp. NPDC049879]|uniref:LamG-like jellyroll fold domain-containing protein n=1 Tax=Streptomyces sp. NPDC049879 TaxID=3365598 RepID=UPI0037BA5B17
MQQARRRNKERAGTLLASAALLAGLVPAVLAADATAAPVEGPPDQITPAQLSMEYGGACRPASDPAWTGSLEQIEARDVTDPDGDTVAVEFAASWDAGDGQGDAVRWESGLTTALSSGSTFRVTLPEDIPPDTPVRWHARSFDGTAYSPWSSSGDGRHACHFVHDRTSPAEPDISSAAYPEFRRDDPVAPWHQGTGHYGSFTLTAHDDDVVEYVYWLNGGPMVTVPTTGGAARTIDWVPPTPSEHTLTVRALDRAGNGSDEVTYVFRVAAGAGPRARWQADEAAGASATPAAVPARWANLAGTATLGTPGTTGTALHLDGATGYAATTAPVVDTSRSFTVSAWARLDAEPAQDAVVVTQTGRRQAGFELSWSAADGGWAFGRYGADAADGTAPVRALATDVDVVPGAWTHLVGTYDEASGQLLLHIDGQLAGTAPFDGAWNAYGRVLIGAGDTGGTPRSFFPGSIDDVRVWDHARTPADPDSTGRPAVARFPLDETTGRRVTGAAAALPAGYHGGVQTGVPGVHGRAAHYNGTDAYATTATGLVDTGRNFAVSAWARLDGTPAADAVVAAQAGPAGVGFELSWSAADDRWSFAQYDGEGAGARVTQPDGQTAAKDTWTHLVGVHDAYAGTLTLYVDGERAGSVPFDTPFTADGPVLIGAGDTGGTPRSFFPGTIDDVRVWDRMVTDYEAAQIYHQAPITP